MSRKVWIIRHGATGVRGNARLQFGDSGAPLSSLGQRQAEIVGRTLRQAGLDLHQAVAVSPKLRAIQTAEGAGFASSTVYDLLDEVQTADPDRTLKMLQEGILPKEAITAAMAVLKNPPAEDIWVTHGLLMAGLAAVADVSPIKGLIPDVGAVQELTII